MTIHFSRYRRPFWSPGWVSVILSCIVCLFLAGCQPAAQPESEKIELEFWTIQLLAFEDYINDMIDTYEATHPNVHIKWVDVPFNEAEKKSLVSMLSPDVPDVINLNPDFSAMLAHRNALLDMNEWVGEAEKASYLPVAWKATTLGEHTFGLPWYITSAVTLYNNQLLQQAGFDAPPRTYQEMADMSQIFREKDLGYLFMPAIAQNGRFFRTLSKVGIPLWNENNELVFAEHGAGEELAFWVDLYRKSLIPKEVVVEGQDAAVDRYQSGTLALLLKGPNFLNIVEENAPKVYQQTQVTSQFPQESRTIDFSTMLLVVPTKSEHPKEAVEFALYVTNAVNSARLAELAPVLPPHTSVLESDAFLQPEATDIKTKARSISARQLLAAEQPVPIHPMQNQLNQLMDFYVQSALLGKLSPEAAMQEAQTRMNEIIH